MKLAGALRLRDVDRGFASIKSLFQTMQHGRDTPAVEVGISGAFGPDVVRYAMAHEYGSKSVPNRPPKRSFVRSTVTRNAQKYAKLLRGIGAEAVARAAHEGKDGAHGGIVRALDQLGRQAAADMRATIDGSIGIEPLAQSTLLQKERLGYPSTPLVRTGMLRRAIAHQVVGPHEPTTSAVMGAAKRGRPKHKHDEEHGKSHGKSHGKRGHHG